MQLSDFHFDLPDTLIAREPLPERSGSRMLLLDGCSGHIEDHRFTDLEQLLEPEDLLILNDTRVIPARLYGRKASGGRLELLFERLLDGDEALVHLRASKSPPAGVRLHLDGGAQAEVVGRDEALFRLRLFADCDWLEYLDRHGHVPLPPYLEREDRALDRERYQTVFAREPGAVAAPTAGLHFDDALLQRLAARGIERQTITLHVGAGTFAPVRETDVSRHRMHTERLQVGEAVCEAVARTRERGGRVVAVGTTVVRALETAARGGELAPYAGETDIFITPGFRFRVVDALLTNFHLPESTLIMLVAAFAGRERVLNAYRHAVARGYRFFSYGDAMFLPRPAPEARAWA
jgi:S-adenosylmethionine:tRNA ribosyltransferase-isomerase